MSPTAASTSGPDSATATSATAGDQSNSFISGQDYIGFDFDDDDGEEPAPHGAVDQSGPGRGKVVNGRHTAVAGPSKGPATLAGAQRNGASRDSERGDRLRSRPASGPGRIQPQGRRRTFEEMAMDDGLTKRERMRSMARATPWALDVDWDSCWHPTEMLHRELEAFERWISPTPWEHDCRAMVIQLIRNAICSQWRDAEVLSFGSHDTRLYMPEGDIDLVVISRSMENEHRARTLNKIAALLRRANLVVDLAVISKAKVPIVKFTCVHAKYKVDISINQNNGLAAAKWVSAWLRKQPSLRPLILAVKLLLNQRGMSEVFNGGLGSYSVICLVISHLQMHPKVQRGELDPAKNLGVLLLEFLELYGKTFNYHTVGISVRGQGHYFEKKRHAFVSGGKPYMLAIEDPLDASNDISRGTFQIQAVRLAMKGAFDILSGALCQRANVMSDPNAQDGAQHAPVDDEDDEARAALMQNAAVGAPVSHPHSLLGTIFGISHETTRAREKIEAMYHSGELHYKLGRPPPPPEDPRPASPLPARSRPPPDDALPHPSRSIPAPPHRGTEERSQRPAGTSAGVKRDGKAFANTQLREAPSQSRRDGQCTTAGSSTAYGTLRQGTRDAPIVIVDGPSEVSSDFEDRMRSAVDAANHLTSRASKGPAALSRGDGDTSEEEELSAVDEAELAESQGFSFGSQSGARQGSSFNDQSGAKRRRVATDESASRSQRRQAEGDDEQDSRYAEHRTKGLRKLHQASRADRREYVERNSESDSDASMHSLDEHPTSQSRARLTTSIPQRGISIAGTAEGTAPAASVTTTSIQGGHRIAQMRDKAAQKRQVADYWAAKAQGSNVVSEESEEGEVHE